MSVLPLIIKFIIFALILVLVWLLTLFLFVLVLLFFDLILNLWSWLKFIDWILICSLQCVVLEWWLVLRVVEASVVRGGARISVILVFRPILRIVIIGPFWIVIKHVTVWTLFIQSVVWLNLMLYSVRTICTNYIEYKIEIEILYLPLLERPWLFLGFGLSFSLYALERRLGYCLIVCWLAASSSSRANCWDSSSSSCLLEWCWLC